MKPQHSNVHSKLYYKRLRRRAGSKKKDHLRFEQKLKKDAAEMDAYLKRKKRLARATGAHR